MAVAAAVVASAAAFWHSNFGAGTGAGTQVTSRAALTTCLQHKSVLVSHVPSSKDFDYAPAASISFALVPGLRLNSARVFFESSNRVANSVVAKLVARFKTQAGNVRSYFTVAGNLVAFWDTPHPAVAARAVLQSCL
jgi:hypothetical protein